MAERHVRDGERRIAELEQEIERATRRGLTTRYAEQALGSMRTTLRLMIEHRSEMERSVANRQISLGELAT
jgi:hypothetical protein